MAQQRFSVFIQLEFVQQSADDYLVANGIDHREQMRATVITQLGGGDSDLDLDILNTCSPQQGRQTPADETITTASMEHSMEGIQQNIPRRMWWLTQPGYIVHIR